MMVSIVFVMLIAAYHVNCAAVSSTVVPTVTEPITTEISTSVNPLVLTSTLINEIYLVDGATTLNPMIDETTPIIGTSDSDIWSFF